MRPSCVQAAVRALGGPPPSTGTASMKVGFAGTPAFAAHLLRALVDADIPVALALTQPDRPRGRGQKLAASPVKELAQATRDTGPSAVVARDRRSAGASSRPRSRRARRRGVRAHPAAGDTRLAAAWVRQRARVAPAALARRGADPARAPRGRRGDGHHADADGCRTRHGSDARCRARSHRRARDGRHARAQACRSRERRRCLSLSAPSRREARSARRCRNLRTARRTHRRFKRAKPRSIGARPPRPSIARCARSIRYPGAATLWSGERVKVWRAQPAKALHGVRCSGNGARGRSPRHRGRVRRRRARCSTELQPAGGRRMSAGMFAAGRKVAPGGRFGAARGASVDVRPRGSRECAKRSD